MKTVNKKLLAVAVAGVLGMGSVSAMAADGLSANVGFVNDYTWRGVTQSANDPATQGGLDYAKGPFSVGMWGSSITAGTELDFYGSYNFGPVAVGAIYYYYPTAGGSFYEVNVGGDVGPVSLMASYSPDVGGVSTTYVEASYSLEVSKGVNLDFHVGNGDSYKTASAGNATDYSLGVSGSAAGLDLSLAYVKSDAAADDKGKTVFSVSKSM